MKIGIDARFFGTETGIGRYVKELIEHLEVIQSEHEFVIFLRKKNFDLYKPRNRKFKKVLADIKWYGLAEQVELPKILEKEKVDLMHFPHFNVPFLYKKPFVATIHDLILLKYPSTRATTLGPIKFFLKYLFYRLTIQRVARDAKFIITPSEYIKKEVIKSFNKIEHKIIVTYEGVSFNLLDTECPTTTAVGHSVSYFLYVGNAYPHKNLEGLIKAFKIFRKYKNDKYKLVLVGKEDYFWRRLKKMAGNTENIIFRGYVADEELAELYQNTEAYIFPSFCEGFGLPGLEAMAHGTPVLASNSSCLSEIYGDAALYFNPQSIDEMVKKMSEIVYNPELRKNLIEKGYERVRKYSWSDCARQTLKVYEEAVSKI
ncbi:MAG: glycosyltransferase family 1 protein [Patescibacteria group bacterium]|nr:glycosyltransferase family 1 protein [Patescibacteria group bacterium]